MHICMDELRLIAPGLLLLAGAFHYLRMIVRRLLAAERKAERGFIEAQHARLHADCGCARVNAPAPKPKPEDEGAGADAAELRRWLDNVAPLLGHRPPPDMAQYPWEKRILRDGSGYLVAGVIYPIHPTLPGSDYYRDNDGFRLATAEESAVMREKPS